VGSNPTPATNKKAKGTAFRFLNLFNDMLDTKAAIEYQFSI
jgi:hypothetical protein